MDRPEGHVTEAGQPADQMSRREVLVAGTGTVLAASGLAACGGDGSARSEGKSSGNAGAGAGKKSNKGSGGESLTEVSQVPVGGAVSATSGDGKPVIVAQPSKGEVVAFSAICTHQGCKVAPAGKVLKCPCHGSTYDLATGKNTGGPAPKPLAKVSVKVEGGKVVEA